MIYENTKTLYVKGLKDEAEALKDITDLERERAKYALDISKQTQDLIEKADAAEYENSKIGATEQQLIALTAARYDEQIALKEEKIAAIEMMEGRTVEQKKKLVAEITRVSVEILGGVPESVDIIITDIQRENWATGGKLWSEPRD